MPHDAEKRPELQDLEIALGGPPATLKAFLENVHPADLAEWLEELSSDDVFRVFESLPNEEERTELLEFAEDGAREAVMRRLSVERIVELIETLPADVVVDLLALTDDATTEHVLHAVDFERAQGLRELASYGEETAGGLMTTEFVAVLEDARVGDAIKEVRAEEGPASEEEVGVFVVDAERRPVGYVSDRDLLTTGIHTPIQEVMETDMITVSAETDQEDVAHLLTKYNLDAIPVVDAGGVLIGVVSAEDAVEVLEEEMEEDIRRLVGTSPVEQTHLPILTRVRGRLPLQALTVVGGLTTAFILDLALPGRGDTASSDILRYLPLIVGLAGNVGIQSSTILVRALATGELSGEREASVLSAEVLVGLLIGMICGLATLVVASFMEGEAGALHMSFGVAVGGAVFLAVTWAALLGCTVPVVCHRLGIDPAIVAGPFLITLADVSGAAIFVAIAYAALGIGGGAGG